MLIQAATLIADIRRRIDDFANRSTHSRTPPGLARFKRDQSYEVTVVDNFYQLGQQSFAHHGTSAM